MNLDTQLPPFNTTIGDLIKGGAIINENRVTGFLSIGLGYSLQNFKADFICELSRTVSGSVTTFEAVIAGRKFQGQAQRLSNGMGLQLFAV